jgi:hypothetical protein
VKKETDEDRSKRKREGRWERGRRRTEDRGGDEELRTDCTKKAREGER